ncbi:MAG: hypothetical protein IPQ07_20750 [Myxococcales bacterium]|nr:hypothetical protein [Myxococcales bacterium]
MTPTTEVTPLTPPIALTFPVDFWNTDFDVIDSFDLDPMMNNTLEDQAYLEYYSNLPVEQDPVMCFAVDDPDPEASASCGEPVPPKLVTQKNYCKIRPGLHGMIVQLEKTKDMTWFKVVNGVAWIAAKIADLFGIPADYALEIANYLVGKEKAIKSLDDLIKELKQWEAAMGKDVCNPLHPDNKDDPDKGSRVVGGWAACKLLAPLDHNFTPKYCNMGRLDKDGAKTLDADCDKSCRENGAINSSNGITLQACKTSCYQTMKTICMIAFSPEKGKDGEQPTRWGKVRTFCDGLTPEQTR